MSTDVALRQVALVSDDLDPVVDQLRSVFGLEVAFRDPLVADFGLQNVVMPVGEQFLEVIAPVQPDTAAGRFLERRGGPGGYLVIMQSADPDHADRQCARHGVRLVLGFDEDGFRCRQFHPADTGGAFLEIDHQQGAGRWHPAGPDWRSSRRTDVLTGIDVVTLQSPDPASIAARWAQLTEVSSADGTAVEFANARADFVPLADDRGTGLSAVTVRAVDPDRARAAADARGLLRDDGSIGICGVRFVLSSGG